MNTKTGVIRLLELFVIGSFAHKANKENENPDINELYNKIQELWQGEK